jgi:hypothetical protein
LLFSTGLSPEDEPAIRSALDELKGELREHKARLDKAKKRHELNFENVALIGAAASVSGLMTAMMIGLVRR